MITSCLCKRARQHSLSFLSPLVEVSVHETNSFTQWICSVTKLRFMLGCIDNYVDAKIFTDNTILVCVCMHVSVHIGGNGNFCSEFLSKLVDNIHVFPHIRYLWSVGRLFMLIPLDGIILRNYSLNFNCFSFLHINFFF